VVTLTADFHDWAVYISLVANNAWAATFDLKGCYTRASHTKEVVLPFYLVFFAAALDASGHTSFGQLL